MFQVAVFVVSYWDASSWHDMQVCATPFVIPSNEASVQFALENCPMSSQKLGSHCVLPNKHFPYNWLFLSSRNGMPVSGMTNMGNDGYVMNRSLTRPFI